MTSKCPSDLCLDKEDSEPMLNIWVLALYMLNCNSKGKDGNLFGPLCLPIKHGGKP